MNRFLLSRASGLFAILQEIGRCLMLRNAENLCRLR
jgi:hypothetical protein